MRWTEKQGLTLFKGDVKALEKAREILAMIARLGDNGAASIAVGGISDVLAEYGNEVPAEDELPI